MSVTVYSAIGSSFGKLLKNKPKPIILAKNVSQESIPFLQGFQSGTQALKPIEDSFVEEIIEDIFETTYSLALAYRGKHYSVQMSDTKDFWLIKEVRITGNPSAVMGKSKKISIPLVIILILVSAVGYMFQFGLFNKKGNTQQESNPTVFDSYVKKTPEQNPDQKTVAQSLNIPASSAASAVAASTGNTAGWEQEKAALQKQIVQLKKENEDLKKQLAGKQPITFVIKPGQSAQDIAKAAQDAGIIASAEDFYRTLIDAKVDQSLAPGSYQLQSGTSYSALIEQLSQGAVHIEKK